VSERVSETVDLNRRLLLLLLNRRLGLESERDFREERERECERTGE
jgi:hypothetical protein